ncbi:MAG TPA: PDZ domain-containing protein [Bryobacteraceae bacterium]|nr:PDZ domain-containing protein [Bryobacteraceae bacterium]
MIRATTLLLFAALAHAADPVGYQLSFERPNTHLMNVTMRISGLDGQSVDVAIPDWAPGAYSIRNFAANVQGFRATDPADHALAWRKTDSQTWRIQLKGATAAIVHYQVFNPQYNDQHVSFTGHSVWMYVVNAKDRPAELTIDRGSLPVEWKIATGMKKTGATSFTAEDYDWFSDYPIEISDYGEQVFDALGTTYHIVVDPKEDRDFAKFAADLKKVVEAEVPILAPAVGGNRAAPFADYYFIMHIRPGGGVGGGVEHLNSTMITYSSGWSDHGAATSQYLNDVYTVKLFVAAHEFFHAWNVKRLRPRELGPFDYTQMVHTPSLWISEGLTSYYAGLALERAGFLTPQQYLEYIGRLFTGLEEKPGRKERSIADTSWDTWFGGAGGGGGGNAALASNLTNTNYSYYDGGQTLGCLLDLEIRNQTHNRKSLDDWMRLMYSRYALPKPGFEPEDAVRAASDVAGADMTAFFDRYVTGKDPLPYERDLAYGAINVETVSRKQPWLGATLQSDSSGRAMVANIVPGSPAESSGLDRGDAMIAIDGKVVDRAAFEKAIAAAHVGEPVALTVNHLGRVQQISVRLATSPYPEYKLKPMEAPNELQREIYRSYLSVP